jgi:hypothetical protein
MKKKSNSKSAFFNFRVLIGLFVVLAGAFLALLSFGFFSSAEAQSRKVDNGNADAVAVAHAVTPVVAKSFDGDVRTLPPVPCKQDEREWEERLILPDLPIGPESRATQLPPAVPIVEVPMPPPIQNFEGIARLDVVVGGQAGCGFPPDTNGEVGLNHYILAVNCAYGIYDKATGTQVAAFTENSLFSGGPTGTLCDTDSSGDPIVVYDQLANRWILTNFAFASFPGPGPFYQCFAVSQTSDPVAGGWFLYAVRIDQGAVPAGTLPDYPKFGHWNDGCLYMGANGFDQNLAFNGTIFASFSKNDMYNGLPLTGAVGIANLGSSLFPTNLLGTQPGQMPPPGTPNYFVRNASTTTFQVRTFTPGPNCGDGGTMSAATTVSHISGPGPAAVPQPNDPGNLHLLDSLGSRIMQKVQYRKVGSAESLWVLHSVRPGGAVNDAPLWAQLDVTGGTIATTPVQQGVHLPDSTLYRWMGSIAADQDGNVAIGYSTSNGVVPNFPSIAYAGRLATDPPNTLPQTETQLIAGGGSQLFDCGGGPCHRWGDYSSMSVDPTDDCTFWYTNQYYPNQDEGNPARRNWHTRIGSFKFPDCGQGGPTPTPTATAAPRSTPTPRPRPTPPPRP